MTNTKRLLLPQCCEYSIYPPPTTLEKTNNFLGAPACARPPLSYRPPPPPARHAATAYGRTAVSGRDVATRRRHRAALRAAASRTFIVDRPLTFVTVV